MLALSYAKNYRLLPLFAASLGSSFYFQRFLVSHNLLFHLFKNLASRLAAKMLDWC
jgi:hypothetical protein